MDGCGWNRVPLKNGEELPLPPLDLGLDSSELHLICLLNNPFDPKFKWDISLKEFEALVAEHRRKEKLLKKLSKRKNFPYPNEEDHRYLLLLDIDRIITITRKRLKATHQANSKVRVWLQTNESHLYKYLKRDMEVLHISPSAEPIKVVSEFLKNFTTEKIHEVLGGAFDSLNLSPRARKIATEIYVQTQYPFFIKHMRRILLRVLIEKNWVDVLFAFLCWGVKKKWF